MNKLKVLAGAIAMATASTAFAGTIGFSSPNFDDHGQTLIREAAKAQAEAMGHSIQIEDAREDVGTQLSHIQNFISSGVDAIVLAPVSAAATPQMTKLANAAGIPLIYVNRRPVDMENLGGSTSFVGSDEKWSGTLQAFEMCNQSAGVGTGVLLMGILSNEAAISRSEDVREVLKLSMCKGITIIHEEVGEWQRTKASDIISNLIASGKQFDMVFANNDEMALGAIQGLKNAGISMDDVIVGGVDATADALAAMKAGDLDVTVFQNLKGQGAGGIVAADKAMNGGSLPMWTNIPFELVNDVNLGDYLK